MAGVSLIWLAAALATTIPLRRSPRPFLSKRLTLLEFRARQNNTHATEWYGSITVGGQSMRVLFDTGSDQLLLPGVDCDSPACKTHTKYVAAKSLNASEPIGELQAVQFGTGEAAGVDRTDVVCLGSSCAVAQFLEAVQESDNPFLHAGFDGVLGLSLPLRKNATERTSVLASLVAAKAVSAAVFAIELSGEPRLVLGPESRKWANLMWVNVSEPGYWQLSLAGVAVGGRDLDVCAAPIGGGMNVTTFFGHMCCRTIEEFETEERCQYTTSGKRS